MTAEFQLTTAAEVKTAARGHGSSDGGGEYEIRAGKREEPHSKFGGCKGSRISSKLSRCWRSVFATAVINRPRVLTGGVSTRRYTGTWSPRPGPADGAAPRRHSGSDRRPLSVDVGRADCRRAGRPGEVSSVHRHVALTKSQHLVPSLTPPAITPLSRAADTTLSADL